MNRAGRRARTRHLRRTGAALAAIPTALGTTALLLGAGTAPAGAATLTVTSLNDADTDGTCDADCTLRDALDDANDGDTIVFQAGLTGDYDITTQLTIDDAVTIQGPGATVIAIDGTDTTRIFELTAGSGDTVTISGLTLKNGSASIGGAIYNNDQGNLVIDGVVFTDNETTGNGGAISQFGGSLTVVSGTFTNNTSAGYAGAIYTSDTSGDVTITGSTFTGNDATGAGKGAGGVAWFNALAGSDLVITDSTFTGNTALDNGGAVYAYNGGAVTITGSTFTDNSANGKSGAVRIDGAAAVTVTNSTFTGNAAGDSTGALEIADATTVTITGSTFTDNEAGSSIGAVYIDTVGDADLSGLRFIDNTATAGGAGALYAYAVTGDLDIESTVFSGNRATGAGGAMYINAVGGDTTISFTTIANNSAEDAGGIEYYYNSGDLIIRNSTISGNTATDGVGGGIYFSSQYEPVSLIIENSTISGNTASVSGGGIHMYTEYELQITQSTITRNTAPLGAGIYMSVPAPAGGKDPKPLETRTTPSGETRTRGAKGGGGPRSAVAAPHTLVGAIVSGNTTTDVGGGAAVGVKNSIVGTTGAGITVTDNGGNVTGDPLLGPLADNGGPTLTHALLPGSPALDTGPDPVPTFPGSEDDQRGTGFARVANGRADIGAFEVQPPEPAPEPEPPVPTPTFVG